MSRKFISSFQKTFPILREIKNPNDSEVTIMRHPTEIKTPDHTGLDLNQDPIFHRFFVGYLDQLRKKLSQIEVYGNGYQYSFYTRGQDHYPRNPNRKTTAGIP